MDLSDILIILGLILFGIGCYILSPPIAFIATGAVIFILGLFGALRPKGGDD
ncbi:hypothetical protein JNUCC1_03346 [Lentibacillus sp. JNUCC-1]|uniref:hypothetical protein n=1 Tax=Lentibacillus sp. JNUCC-1 TaxID=2654513 RepID=UPI0012E84110|nr:hypothetical protein [Lentibacillus sp. JNUCC-1]MUV39468.1 hypothetical protein [Lentibacillus sp. JNUCC-1]